MTHSVSNPFLVQRLIDVDQQSDLPTPLNTIAGGDSQETEKNQITTTKSKVLSFQSIFTSRAHRHPPIQGNPLLNTGYTCSRRFTDLPAELLHIILIYYARSFTDLIKFSSINKTCKQVSDYSLLWLQMKLTFYPPRSFISLEGYQPYTRDLLLGNYEDFLEAQIRQNFLPTRELSLFSIETEFPPVYKVFVKPYRQDIAEYKTEFPSVYKAFVTPYRQDIAEYKTAREELDCEVAYRVGKWWRSLYTQYQQLYHLQVVYTPYFTFISNQTSKINRYFNHFIFGVVIVGIVSIYLLFDCKNTNLSVGNKIGLSLLLGIIGFYIVLTLIYVINSFADGQLYNYATLRIQWTRDLTGCDAAFIQLASMFISLSMVFAKCVGSLDCYWWETVLPLWFGFSIVYWMWYRATREKHDVWDTISKAVGGYFAISPPLTCTLIACYYDNIYTEDFQYTLVPLYPLFFFAFVGLVLRILYSCILIYDIRRGRTTITLFDNDCLNYLAYVLTVSMTTFCAIVNSWSVMMLLIDSYRIDDTEWDKGLFGVHFTPLTCFLIFLFTIPIVIFDLFVDLHHFSS